MKHRKCHLALIVAGCLLFLMCSHSTMPKAVSPRYSPKTLYDATVTAVLDGDTIKVTFLDTLPEGCGKQETVRFIGVDTPEMNLHKDAPPESEDERQTSKYDW